MSIWTILINALVVLAIGKEIFDNRADIISRKSVLFLAYCKRLNHYVWAFMIILLVIVLSVGIINIGVPKFMLWSWVSIFTDDSGTNVVSMPLKSGTVYTITLFWAALSIALPYLAKTEEEIFRQNKNTHSQRIFNSIKFGLMHMTVGVPLLLCLILSLVGYVFSIFYMIEYNKSKSYELALEASTSIHSKYNFILISILALAGILTQLHQ